MRRYLIWCIGALAAAFVVYELVGRDAATVDLAADVKASTPDVYAEDVLFTQLRADGSLHYRLHAASIEQFNSPQQTYLKTPHLQLINPTQPPWDITAEQGHIRQRKIAGGGIEDIVHLRDAVELVQQHATMGNLTMRSNSFFIYPNRQFAETSQDVMIITNIGQTQAAGLSADLGSGLLKLTSNRQQRVRTTVMPNNFKKS